MPNLDTYTHSPLSNETVKVDSGKALLLQFILSEFFHCTQSNKKEDLFNLILTPPARFFPFDWSYQEGYLNKMNEHAQLLPHAFENDLEPIDDFQTILSAILDELSDRKKTGENMEHSELLGALSELFFKLIPFLISCKESENLVLFLLKHGREIDTLFTRGGMQYLLNQMFPDGDFEKICDRYEKRGYAREKSQCEMLITHYERTHP